MDFVIVPYPAAYLFSSNQGDGKDLLRYHRYSTYGQSLMEAITGELVSANNTRHEAYKL
jgi:hypothetical protein